MTALSDPGLVVNRLEEIDRDLALLQNDYESSAADFARAKRDWEKALAECHITAEGSNSDTRKANALLAAIRRDRTYETLKTAEGAFEGCRAANNVLNTRAMIGMAILRSQGRT